MPVRAFTQRQFPALLDFVENLRSWDSQGRELGRRTFEETLNQPGSVPENDCFLLEENGRIQGFCLVVPELPINRAVLELEIDPQLEGGPSEKEVVLRALDRAREMGAEVVHVCVASASRSKLLEDQGFSLVRTYWDMLWRQEELPKPQVPPGFRVRSFAHGDAPVLTAVQNAAFEGSWGFCPNTVEQTEYRRTMANTSKQGIIFLSHGDETAGYCWTCVSPTDGATRGVIGMIGVVPDYRGRGVSRTILLAAMEYLRSIGVADIGLQVDGSNTPAIRLYTSVGFQKTGELQWLERGLS